MAVEKHVYRRALLEVLDDPRISLGKPISSLKKMSTERLLHLLESAGYEEETIYARMVDDLGYENAMLCELEYPSLLSEYLTATKRAKRINSKGQNITEMVRSMIDTGKHTRKTIFDAIKTEFPDVRPSYPHTLLSRISSPKHTPLKDRYATKNDKGRMCWAK